MHGSQEEEKRPKVAVALEARSTRRESHGRTPLVTMSTVLPRPSRLPSNRPVGRPRPPTPAPVKRARSRSTSADSDIEIVEPSAAVVPLDKGKSRAGNDGAATDLAPGAPDVARRSTSGERGSIASGAGDETRGPGRPPRSLPRLAGTSSASAVASSSATTLEAPTVRI